MPQDYQWTDPTSTDEENQPQRDLTPSPDQTSMFSVEQPSAEQTAEPTRMEIPHEDSIESDAPVTTLYSNNDMQSPSETVEDSNNTGLPETYTPEGEQSHDEDAVSSTTKAKIIAAIAIVIVAGYVAYWVQEPVQIKADVTSESMVGENLAADEDTNTDLVAAADDIPTGTSVSVDVSLFGFEPATLEIDKDTIVVWTNTSTEDQTIIGSSDDGQSFVSPVLASGETFTYKFEQDATFTYYSTYNPALKASIVVGLGGDTIGQPLDGELPAGRSLSADTTTPVDEGVLSPEEDMTANELLEQAIAARDAQIATSEDAVLVNGELQPQSDTLMESNNQPVTDSTTAEELHMASDPNSPDNLAKTGPAETIYAVMLLGIAWLNRKKLYKAFSKF